VDKVGRGAGTTLEYGVADFALALMAHGLGRRTDAARALTDSLRYRKLLDPETRFIRPRRSDGSWHSPFDPTEETGFQEGNSWQYSWLAPHDARGLFDRMGGDAVVAERLDSLFRDPPEVQKQATVFGLFYRTDQYAPGNEHDIQVPWMYPFAGKPWRTAAELREIETIFRPTLDGLPGNDDLGGLSGWYVFAALGFGPVTPGAPFYVIAGPQFSRARIAVPGRRAFTLEAPGASEQRRYVRSATLDGRALERSWFGDAAVRGGSTLRLEVGTEPDERFGAPSSARPPSATGSSLGRFGCRPKPAPRIRLTVSPRRALVGQRVRFRFHATATVSGRRAAVPRALVSFTGNRFRTGSDGRAAVTLTLRVPASYRPVARKEGFRDGRASVVVSRPQVRYGRPGRPGRR
jgi:putative alpha-1,2-mannosidase